MAVKDARSLAIGILFRQERSFVPLEEAFQATVFRNLSQKDQSLCRRLVDGVLRNLSRLDFYIDKLSRRPPEKLDREIVWILRVSLYQMESLRIPDYAVLNEAARMCLVFRKGSAKGFVNAILRSFQRKRPPLPRGAAPEALAIRFSHPAWLVERYLRRWGRERATALLEQNNEIPRSVLWVNAFKTSLESFLERLESERISYRREDSLPNCIEVESSGFSKHPLYRQGSCFFMDLSSQRVAQFMDLFAGCNIGDLCAAPGGKSFVLASRMGMGTRLVSSDSNYSRLEEMRRRVDQYEVSGISLLQADLTRQPPFGRVFDRLLIDVPCSGLGTLRSNPEIRWRVREEDLVKHQRKQSLILEHAFDVLKPGGELVYSTCSTEPEENEGVVEPFLAREKQAVGVGESLKTFPRIGAGDGFFAHKIRRI